MTKKEWVSYIKNHLHRVDETNKYHKVVVEKTIDTIHSQMFSQEYMRNKKGMWKYLKEYSITAPSSPSNTKIPITQIPVTLPRANGGVFRVDLTVGSSDFLCELTPMDMFRRVADATYDTLGVQGKYLVAYHDNGLYFHTGISSQNTVTYTILPKFSTLSDSDEVLLPVGAEEVMADRILDTMRMIPPVDLMNDNADTNG
jgi:hypothetical protein